MRPYEKFGPFLLAYPLGRGGMGEVYAARTPWPGRPIAAVKRLRADVASTPTYAERFSHEAELAVRLEHPNIVDTIDVGAVDGRLYIASELILGKSVGAIADHLLMQRQGAPTAIVIRILIDVLAGLAYGHAATDRDGRWLRLVHRDVTPGNVLVGYDGIVRLTDFGLAKSLLSDENLTQTGAIVGTPSYIAPELIRAERPTPAADIYSLGAVAYRFLTGIPPFEGTKAEIMNRALTSQPRSVVEIRPDLPAWFVELVHSMLEPVVGKRPGDARVLAADLERQAKAHDLLIEPSWVDLWMATYFEKARQQALADAQAVAAIQPIEPNLVFEKTQIFARSDILSATLERARDPTMVGFADQDTRIYRDDLTARDAPADLHRDPDTDQGGHVRVDDLRLASPEPRRRALPESELFSPRPSRAEPTPGPSGLPNLLESGALVSPVGETSEGTASLAPLLAVPGRAPGMPPPVPPASSAPSGPGPDATLPAGHTPPPAAPITTPPPSAPLPTAAATRPTGRAPARASRPKRRPLLMIGTLCLALAVAIMGVITLRPSIAADEARRRVIARLDAVRARVDRKIERRESIPPGAMRLLADSTRAALAADYARADGLLGDLEQQLEQVLTSTQPR